jgi:hypothetical protein
LCPDIECVWVKPTQIESVELVVSDSLLVQECYQQLIVSSTQ